MIPWLLATSLALAGQDDAVVPAPADGARTAWTLSGTGGADLAMNQVWSGVELALHPTQRSGLAPQLRLTPSFSLTDYTPLVWAEVGGSVVIPSPESPEATVRIGVLGRAAIPFVTYALPLRLGDTGSTGTGLVPSGQAFLEIGWQDRTRVLTDGAPPVRAVDAVMGLRAGPGSLVSGHQCTETSDGDTCLVWVPGLVLSFYSRLDWPSGLHAEVALGTVFQLSVGRRF